MSSLQLFNFREIIEPARICSSSCPRGVAAAGRCTAPRTSAPDNTVHAPVQPHPHHHQYPALKLWQSPDLRAGPKLFWWPHMLQPPHVMMRTHAQPLVDTAPSYWCMAWHISYTTLYCICGQGWDWNNVVFVVLMFECGVEVILKCFWGRCRDSSLTFMQSS